MDWLKTKIHYNFIFLFIYSSIFINILYNTSYSEFFYHLIKINGKVHTLKYIPRKYYKRWLSVIEMRKRFFAKKNHKRVVFVFHYDTESFDKIRYEEKKERNNKLMFHGNVVVFYYLVSLFWCHQDICGTLVTDLRFYILLWKGNRIIKNFYIQIEECFFILF